MAPRTYLFPRSRSGVPLAASATAVIGLAGLLAWPTVAAAHVKWFAPYIVDASPQPISATLTNLWFWTGICLVTVFFLATIAVERTRLGAATLNGLNALTDTISRRADDFMRASIAAFFVAIFAVGGVYLTPELKTDSELISWAQLAIAVGIFSRRTMPYSAAGILALWVLALSDYDFFHLLDYLALGVGVAGYLFLASLDNPRWRESRFTILVWGVAVALMWSSLEKFAYPNWFYPLVEERPFLTFGMPRDIFIPMAGVAEFTLGFGLLWTPLVRRLSAISLLAIFIAAVYPFGRIDLVGHALIMAVLVLIAADHEPLRAARVGTRPLFAGLARFAAVPTGLAAAMIVVVSAYWGTHAAFYGLNNSGLAEAGERSTHSYSPEHPHGPQRLIAVDALGTHD